MDTISIRKAEGRDARGIFNVYYKTWLATYPNEEYGISVEDIEDYYKDKKTDEIFAVREKFYDNPPPHKIILVATDGEKVVGVSRLALRKKFNELDTLYVLPEYQGKGIGKMLWDKAQEYFDKTLRTKVVVTTYNTKAFQFYEKLGFADSGKRFTKDKFCLKSGNCMPKLSMWLSPRESSHS